MENKLRKENGGITLIALVITVIVLLILAGISISMLSRDNSILSRAGEARDSTKNKEIEEKAKIAYAAALTMGKGIVTEGIFDDELEKAFGENGYELSTDEETQEWVVTVDSVERYRVRKGSTASANSFGYNATENCFIGQKSTGKIREGEIDNQWKNATPITIDEKDGYKFTAGHFVHISNYDGYLWDETEGDLIRKTGADVYLCWNDEYGTITSEQDLFDYADESGKNVYWDIFDASSGAWLNNDSTIKE